LGSVAGQKTHRLSQYPTGRQVELKGITIHRIEGGKIVEEWESYDNLSILQQLGLVPEQEQASS